MSDLLNISILAIVQGLTEFLPVSSSGHLALAQAILGFETLSGVGVDLLLHAATVIAVLVYYRRFIGELIMGLVRREAESWRFAIAIVISMIPAVVVGLLFRDQLAALTESPTAVCCCLIVTGVLLLLTRIVPVGDRKVTLLDALLIGLAQAVAMLPGISRSGSTIAMSRFLKVGPDKAAAFSFLMVIPVIIGGTAYELMGALKETEASAFEGLTWSMGILGFVLAAVVGYLSVAWMVRLLGKRHFWMFGFYCLAVGIAGLLWAFIH